MIFLMRIFILRTEIPEGDRDEGSLPRSYNGRDPSAAPFGDALGMNAIV
jgi:hypothetical protein